MRIGFSSIQTKEEFGLFHNFAFIKYMIGYFINEVGIDPGDKTRLACVRCNMKTGTEARKLEFVI